MKNQPKSKEIEQNRYPVIKALDTLTGNLEKRLKPGVFKNLKDFINKLDFISLSTKVFSNVKKDKANSMPYLEAVTAGNLLEEAIKIGSIEVAESLLISDALSKSRISRLTPLMLAVMWNNKGVVEQLIRSKAPHVNYASPHQGETALMLAVKKGNVSIVELLLSAPGINVNYADMQCYTALMYACQEDSVVMVKLLLAEPSIKVDNTTVEYAKSEEIKVLILSCIKFKSDINKHNFFGNYLCTS